MMYTTVVWFVLYITEYVHICVSLYLCLYACVRRCIMLEFEGIKLQECSKKTWCDCVKDDMESLDQC